MKVYVDLTEFLSAPLRTGIQRVCGELCRHWPPDISAYPVKVAPGSRLVHCHRDTLRIISSFFQARQHADTCRADVLELAAQADASGNDVTLEPDDRVLVPEVFYNLNRFAFYDSLSPSHFRKFHFIVYDLLPITQPEYFPGPVPHELISRYFRLIRRAENVGFISRSTRAAYLNRMCRHEGKTGPVFREGSDGLGPRTQRRKTSNSSPTFVVVGTIEPRKNHGLVLDAVAGLSKMDRRKFRLVFAGRMGWVDRVLETRIRSLSSSRGLFRFVENPGDHALRRLIANARASIFVSSAEGYGLPPLESLWLGVPVIATTHIPSLEDLGERGVHVVDSLDAEGIEQAIKAFLDEHYYKKKAREVSMLSLPTWAAFARDVASWMVGRSRSIP